MREMVQLLRGAGTFDCPTRLPLSSLDEDLGGFGPTGQVAASAAHARGQPIKDPNVPTIENCWSSCPPQKGEALRLVGTAKTAEPWPLDMHC